MTGICGMHVDYIFSGAANDVHPAIHPNHLPVHQMESQQPPPSIQTPRPTATSTAVLNTPINGAPPPPQLIDHLPGGVITQTLGSEHMVTVINNNNHPTTTNTPQDQANSVLDISTTLGKVQVIAGTQMMSSLAQNHQHHPSTLIPNSQNQQQHLQQMMASPDCSDSSGPEMSPSNPESSMELNHQQPSEDITGPMLSIAAVTNGQHTSHQGTPVPSPAGSNGVIDGPHSNKAVIVTENSFSIQSPLKSEVTAVL